MVKLLLLSAFVATTFAIPFLSSNGSDGLLVAGKHYELTCLGESDIQLFHDGAPLTTLYKYPHQGRVKMVKDIPVATVAAAGTWVCSDSSGLANLTVTVVNITATHIQGEENSTSIELSCTVPGAEPHSGYHYGRFIAWSKGSMELNNVTNGGRYAITTSPDGFQSNLNISRPNASDAGEYTCTVQVDIGNKMHNVSQAAKLFWHPYISAFGKQRSRVEDETAEIECMASGYPVPNITWMLQPEEGLTFPVIIDGGRVKANTSSKGVPNALLIVSNLKIDQDRGTYICIAANEFGSANASVALKVKDKLAAVWPFLGICAEVAILCSIIFIFEKRRNKKLEEEEEVEAVKQELLNHPGRENEESKDNTEMRKRPVKA